MFTERLLAGAAVDADDQAERSGPAGRHAGHGVLHHDRPLLVDAELPGGVQNRSGAGLPLRCSCAATTPSTTTANRSAAGRLEHRPGVAGGRHNGIRLAIGLELVEQA